MAFLQHIGPQVALAFSVTAALAWMGLVFGLSKLLRDRRDVCERTGSARVGDLQEVSDMFKMPAYDSIGIAIG